MLKHLIVVAALMTSVNVAAQEPAPATVVVGFDEETVTPLIVEGIADRETGRVVEANDPVRIASISKLIMAIATLRLVDEGKVDLDADVSDYLGCQGALTHFSRDEGDAGAIAFPPVGPAR